MNWLKKMVINAFWMSLVVCLFRTGWLLYQSALLCSGHGLMVGICLTSACVIAAPILGIQKGVFCQILGYQHESPDGRLIFDTFTVQVCQRCGDVKIKEKAYGTVKQWPR